VIYCDPPYIGQFDLYTGKRFGPDAYQTLHDALQAAWLRGAVVVIQSSAHEDAALPYARWCRVFCTPIRRRIKQAKGYTGSGLYDWEMMLVSQSRQVKLFKDEREDTPEHRCFFGLYPRGEEAIWHEQTNSWERWPPLQEYPYEMGPSALSNPKHNEDQMALF